jgi:hypothetical protein
LPDDIFSNQNPTLGKFWRALKWILEYIPFYYILRPFGNNHGITFNEHCQFFAEKVPGSRR